MFGFPCELHHALSAGPGVLVGTVLTAVLVKYTFPYGWSWTLSLLFGAMFSATDPVAVVAVLKEVRFVCSREHSGRPTVALPIAVPKAVPSMHALAEKLDVSQVALPSCMDPAAQGAPGP